MRTSSRQPTARLLFYCTVAVILLVPAVATSQPAQEPDAEDQGYLIGVGDLLKTSVWKNAELAATAPVRPDGRISVPLVGEVAVAGLTPSAVREVLTRRFEEFVNAPAVSVLVLEINSRKVFILGEVAESGAYDILQPTRLIQALAMAGGFTEFAKKDSVILLRGDRRLKLSVKAITAGTDPQDNVLLEAGDTIVVP